MSKYNFNERFYNIAKKLNLTSEQANELVYLFNPKTWENEENTDNISNNKNTIDYFSIHGNSTAINYSDFNETELKAFIEFLNSHSIINKNNNLRIIPIALYNLNGGNTYFLNYIYYNGTILKLKFIANLIEMPMDEINYLYTKVISVECNVTDNKVTKITKLEHRQKQW